MFSPAGLGASSRLARHRFPRRKNLGHRFVPHVERLEDRLLLATVNWVSETDGFWDVASNWRDDSGVARVPAASDDAVLNVAGDVEVTIRDFRRINSVQGDQKLAIQAGGELEIDGDSTYAGDIDVAGILDLDGPLTAQGSMQWNSGTVDAGAKLLIFSGASMAINGSEEKSLRGSAGIDVAGTVTQSGSGNIDVSSFASSGGIFVLDNGLYDLQTDADITGFGRLEITGTYRKSGGNGTNQIAVELALSNTGLLDVQSGTVALSGTTTASSNGGMLNVATGATLDLTGGDSRRMTGSFVGSGNGRVELASGTLVMVNSDVDFNMPPGLFHWTGGRLAGVGLALINSGELNISGPDEKSFQTRAEIVNRGTVIHSGTGNLAGTDRNVIDNEPGALWDIRTDANTTGPLTLNNFGTLRKSAGTGETNFSATLNGAGGTFEVQVGKLTLEGITSHADSAYDVAGGAIMTVDEVDLAGSISGTGAGRFELFGRMKGDNVNPPRLDFPEGMFHWLGGGGTTAGTIINDGFITLSGDVNQTARASISNLGTVIQQDEATFQLFQTSQINNLGLWEIRGDGDVQIADFSNVGSVFHNLGTLQKSAGTGTSRLFSDLTATSFLNNTGTIDVQSGTLELETRILQLDGDTLHGGTWKVGPSATLNILPAVSIVDNRGNIVLQGAGSSFASIDNVTTNSGSLTLRGRDFASAGDLTNGAERIETRMTDVFQLPRNRQAGIAVSPATGNLFVHARNEVPVRELTTDGVEVSQFDHPSDALNTMGMEFTSAPLNLGGVDVPAGTLLFVDGDVDPPMLFALDETDGKVLASVELTAIGEPVTGVAHHPGRGTLLLISSVGTIHEVDAADGTIISSFSGAPAGSPAFSFAGFGGMEVNETTGNLYVVSSPQVMVRELTASGQFVQDFDLSHHGPANHSDQATLADIAIDNATGDLWLLDESEAVYKFSPLATGSFGELTVGAASTLSVNGDYTQAAGMLTIEIGGEPIQGEFGAVEATGTADLSGTLRQVVVNDFEPVTAHGSAFRVMTFADRVGDFDQFDLNFQFSAAVDDRAAFMFIGNVPEVDLVVSEVLGPTNVVAGDTATIQWTVTNQGTNPATGPWHDQLTLSRLTEQQDPDAAFGFSSIESVVLEEIVAATVEVGTGLTLDPFESATFTADVRVPGSEIGDYHWTVRTNRQADVFERDARDNNVGSSADPVTLDVTEIQVDGPPMDGTFTAARQSQWFRFTVPAGRDVLVELDLLDDTGVTELYLGRAFLPGRFDFTFRHEELGAPDTSTVATGGPADQTWYLLVFPNQLDNTPSSYSLSAQLLDLVVDQVTPPRVGAEGETSLQITGDRLKSALQYQVVAPDGATVDASRVVADGSEGIYATFDFTGATLGSYDVVVSDATGELARLDDGFVVEPVDRRELEMDLVLPSLVRSGRTVPIDISYRNSGNVDLNLPIVTVTASTGDLRPQRDSGFIEPALTLIPPMAIDGLTTIPPGAEGQFTLYYTAPLEEVDIQIDVFAQTTDDPTFAGKQLDWDTIAAGLVPPDISPEDLATFIADNRGRFGDTFGALYDFIAGEFLDLASRGHRDIMFVEGQVHFRPAEVDVPSDSLRGQGVDDLLSDPLSPGLSVPPIVQRVTTGDSGTSNVYVLAVGAGGDLPGAAAEGGAFADGFKSINLPEGSTVMSLIDGRTDDANGERTDVTADDVLSGLDQIGALEDSDDITVVFLAGHGDMGRPQPIRDEQGALIDLDFRPGQSPRFRLGSDKLFPSDINAALKDFDGKTVFISSTCRCGTINESITADVKIAASTMNRIRDDFQLGNFLIQEYLRDPDIDVVGDSRQAFQRYLDAQIETARKEGYPERAEAIMRTRELVVGEMFSAVSLVEEWKIRRPADSVPPDQRTPELVQIEEERRQLFRNLSYANSGLPNIDSGGSSELKLPGTPKGGASDEFEGDNTNDPDDKPPKDSEQTRSGRSFDPNEKVGPIGFGPPGFITGENMMPFTIFFENDPQMATLPAQEVTVTEVLDDDLDLSTFELGDIAIGSKIIDVPPGMFAYSTREDLLLHGNDLLVQVDAELDFPTRTVTWKLTSIDPVTGQFTTDPLAGILPVNDDTGRGEGSVSYRVGTQAGLPSETPISGPAEIVFDLNEPIVTNSTLHTLDTEAPASQVASLPAGGTAPHFAVSWSGDDGGGSGVAEFDIYVSTDGGPFEIWLEDTTGTTATYFGRASTSYEFYSVATDHVGNQESIPAAPDASVTTGSASIADHRVFYNNTSLDGDSPDAAAADDAAIAPSPTELAGAGNDPALGKTALRAGDTATFQNYTGFVGGLTGVMIDVVGLANPDALTAADFQFTTGNHADPASWSAANDPLSISVRENEGAGGADRVTIIWNTNNGDDVNDPHEAVAGQWLGVRLLATPNTGLAQDDWHAWGNAPGEVGNSSDNAVVNVLDALLTFNALASNVGPENNFDHNRDGTVNINDALLSFNGLTAGVLALQQIELTNFAATESESSPQIAPIRANQIATTTAQVARLWGDFAERQDVEQEDPLLTLLAENVAARVHRSV